jgi:hypothetical protein
MVLALSLLRIRIRSQPVSERCTVVVSTCELWRPSYIALVLRGLCTASSESWSSTFTHARSCAHPFPLFQGQFRAWKTLLTLPHSHTCILALPLTPPHSHSCTPLHTPALAFSHSHLLSQSRIHATDSLAHTPLLTFSHSCHALICTRIPKHTLPLAYDCIMGRV